MSHELKTPLTSISGFAEILAQGETDKKTTKDFAKTIYEESQRMISLVNDIIKLSKLDEKSISVSDTGIGIPENEQERIFERFYRVDKSRSKSLGGTGLGLSIVKHAAKYHNAKISLESKVGEGSKFTVEF